MVKSKGRVNLRSAIIAVSAEMSLQTGLTYGLRAAQARGDGLWPVATQPQVAPVCRLMANGLPVPVLI